MIETPMAISFFVLSLLALGWMGMRERVIRSDQSLAFHVSSYQRDQRKALFYFRSVWIGLLAAFAGLAGLNMIAAGVSPDSVSVRRLLLGAAYGVGLWGVMIVGMVWTQVGKRVSEANSDGQSLLPVREKKK